MDEYDNESAAAMEEVEAALYARIHYDLNGEGNDVPACQSPVYTTHEEMEAQDSELEQHQLQQPQISTSFNAGIEQTITKEYATICATTNVDNSSDIANCSSNNTLCPNLNNMNNQKTKRSSDKQRKKIKNVLKSPKDGPFQRQSQKLNKLVLIQQKKAKGEKAQSKMMNNPMETIDLNTSDSSDDCIILPENPPPVYVIDESDDEYSNIPSTSQAAQMNRKIALQNATNVPEYDTYSDESSDSIRLVNRTPTNRVIHSSSSDIADTPITQIDLDRTSGSEVSGIPYIVRGPAIEHNTSNSNTVFQTRLRRQSMCDAAFLGKIDSLAKTSQLKRGPQSDDSSDDSDSDTVPRRTPREIAETALKNLREAKMAKRQKLDKRGNNSRNESTGKGQDILINTVPKLVDPNKSQQIISKPMTVTGKPTRNSKPKLSKTMQNSPSNSDEKTQGAQEQVNRNVVSADLSIKSSDQGSGVDILPLPVSSEVETILMKFDEFLVKKKEEQKKRREEENHPYMERSNDDIIATLPVDSEAIQPHVAEGGVTYFVKYFYDKPPNSGVGWTDEMKRFYENSWQGENFDVNKITKNMNADKRLWIISNADLFDNPTSKRIKCHKCLEYGHLIRDCKRPKRPVVCTVCGEYGHLEPRCPNTICLRCGKKTGVFTKSCNSCRFYDHTICALCKVRGHTNKECPDKWRRYHATIRPNQEPKREVQYTRHVYCSVCGKRGHSVEYCRSFYKFMDYPASTSTIICYTPTYRNSNSLPGAIISACNLLYNPKVKPEFHMAEKSQASSYYGRYLNAVGLGNLLNIKRGTTAALPGAKKKRKSVPPTQSHTLPKQSLALPKPPSASPKHVRAQQKHSSGLSKRSSVDVSNEVAVVQDDIELAPETGIPGSDKNENIFLPESIITTSKQPAKDQAAVVDDSSRNRTDCSSTMETMLQRVPTKGVMGETPDFISLGDYSNDDIDLTVQTGISLKYSAPRVAKQLSNNINVVCEDGKIYLLKQHSKYMLSPPGSEFLAKLAADHKIKARLAHGTVGYTLIVSGSATNQEQFHADFRAKCQEITQSEFRRGVEQQMVPRRTESLIRVLRENINLLMQDLGDVNELHVSLKLQSDDCTRTGMKAADKARRTLNMILLGQAGLAKGDDHIHDLVQLLARLIKNCDPTSNVPHGLRETINKHFMAVFSPKPVDGSYEELINSYNHLLPNEKYRNITVEFTEDVQKAIQCKTPKFAQNPCKSQQNPSKAESAAAPPSVAAPSVAAALPAKLETHGSIMRLVSKINSSFAPKRRGGSIPHSIIAIMPECIHLMEKCILLTRPGELLLKKNLQRLLTNAKSARFSPKQFRMAAGLYEIMLSRSSE